MQPAEARDVGVTHSTAARIQPYRQDPTALEIYLADFWIIEAADLDVALQHVAEESRAGEIAPLRGRGATVALTYRANRTRTEHVAAELRARGGSASHEQGRVRLALLASCGGKRWVVEDAGSVLDELDAAVEGSAFDHVECDVGVAVVDAF